MHFCRLKRFDVLACEELHEESEWPLMLRRFRAARASSGSVGGQLRSAELSGCFCFSAGEGTALAAWVLPSASVYTLSRKYVSDD